MEAIKQFLIVYLNSMNAFIVIAGIMLLLMLTYVLVSSFGTGTLRKLNKVLSNETGEDAIKKIEGLRLHGRYKKMWDAYYEAYCHEDTAALSNYLIKKDMNEGKNLFRLASRVIAVVGFSFTFVGVMKIPGLFESEKNNLYCMALALLSTQAVFEFFYTVFETAKRKRVIRAVERFEMLAYRKLPGKTACFEARSVVNKLDGIISKADAVRSGVNQLNARLDRQYRFLEDMNKEEEPEEKTEVKEEKTEVTEEKTEAKEEKTEVTEEKTKDKEEKTEITEEKTENEEQADNKKTQNT